MVWAALTGLEVHPRGGGVAMEGWPGTIGGWRLAWPWLGGRGGLRPAWGIFLQSVSIKTGQEAP